MADDSKWNKRKMEQKENGTEEKNAIVFDGYVLGWRARKDGYPVESMYVIQGRSNSLGSGDSAVGYHQQLDSTRKWIPLVDRYSQEMDTTRTWILTEAGYHQKLDTTTSWMDAIKS